MKGKKRPKVKRKTVRICSFWLNGSTNVVILSFVLICMFIKIYNFKKRCNLLESHLSLCSFPADNKPDKTGVSSVSPLTHLPGWLEVTCARVTTASTEDTGRPRPLRAGLGPFRSSRRNAAHRLTEKRLPNGLVSSGYTLLHPDSSTSLPTK